MKWLLRHPQGEQMSVSILLVLLEKLGDTTNNMAHKKCLRFVWVLF